MSISIDTNVCPVISIFVTLWNNRLSDEERTRLIEPLLPRLAGTAGSDALAKRRAFMAADWFVRVYAPGWLALAKLKVPVNTLMALPEITSEAQLADTISAVQAARDHAYTAWTYLRDEAWELEIGLSGVRDVTWDVEGSAGSVAASAAAEVTGGSSAVVMALASEAASFAVCLASLEKMVDTATSEDPDPEDMRTLVAKKLGSVKFILQTSAQELLERMVALSEDEIGPVPAH